MATQGATFQDLQSIATQIVNDNTKQNNEIAAQLKEVQQLLTDFAAKANQGTSVSASQLQQVVSQLQAVDSLIQSNTSNIQASSGKITEADPAPAPPSTPPAESSGSSEGSSSPATPDPNVPPSNVQSPSGGPASTQGYPPVNNETSDLANTGNGPGSKLTSSSGIGETPGPLGTPTV